MLNFHDILGIMLIDGWEQRRNRRSQKQHEGRRNGDISSTHSVNSLPFKSLPYLLTRLFNNNQKSKRQSGPQLKKLSE